ncbi:MAG: hypothetical protein N3B01_03410 [Verrucomicrobiae bacterium]|nr:hypothetical protein [Verrucomicrobiae bacterium]
MNKPRQTHHLCSLELRTKNPTHTNNFAVLLTIATLFALTPCSPSAPAPRKDQPPSTSTVTEKPPLTDEVLLNPGMGIVIMPAEERCEGDWFVDVISVVYWRVE